MSAHLTKEHLEQYRNKTATAKELVRIDRHLANCQACRNEWLSFAAPAAFPMTLFEESDIHLSYELIEAFVFSQTDDIDSEIVTSHMESCEQCADRVKNLQGFAAVLAAAPDARSPVAARTSAGSVWSRIAGWFQGGTPAARWNYAVIAAVAVLVAGVVIIREQNTRLTPDGLQDGGAALAIPDQYQRLIESVAGAPVSEIPALLEQVRAGEDAPEWLTEPRGRVIAGQRPVFRWKSVAGADSYQVTVQHDSKTVAEANVEGTEWTIGTDLERGAVFSWAVVPYQNGKPLQEPLSAPGVRFGVMSQEDYKLLADARERYPDVHVLIAAILLRAGLIDEAEQELRRHAGSAGTSALSGKLAERITAIRSASGSK